MGLSELFQKDRDPRSIVARRWDSQRGCDSAVCWSDLLADVGALRQRLSPEPEGVWLLVSEDAYAFAVGLMGLWHSGRSAICPPNQQPGTLNRLQTSVAGVLTDRVDWFLEGNGGASGGPIHPLPREHGSVEGSTAFAWPALRPDSTAFAWPALRPDRVALQLFTSGTTGEAKPVAKALAHLDAEVEQLEALWGERLGAAEVFGTVSHQHFYGMMFRVLWPLAAGRPFRSGVFLHPQELVPRMRASGPCALASVPTHLKRMVKHRAVTELRGVCTTTFSSGGVLAAHTAEEWQRSVGEAPIEIFGSTETGVVASRICHPGRPASAWTALPGVRVEPQDGRLRVRSPFVSSDDPSGSLVMGDRARWTPDGTFELQGRGDRVVKVGEKRLDLTKMESALRAHSLVDEVALLLLDQDSEARVAAVVVPSARGREILERGGRMMLGRALAETLAEDWDRVLLPRVWRTVDELPENEQGKPTSQALLDLFASGRQRPFDAAGPVVLDERVSDDSIEFSCLVPEDLPCFPDHFPGLPLVPGVMQLDWALTLAARLFEGPLDVREIGALKFRSALEPGARFRLRVQRTGSAALEFRVWEGEREFASGRAKVSLPGERAS